MNPCLRRERAGEAEGVAHTMSNRKKFCDDERWQDNFPKLHLLTETTYVYGLLT
jgi:hypothetical protein